jgi:hypothetical protein
MANASNLLGKDKIQRQWTKLSKTWKICGDFKVGVKSSF